MTDAMWFDVPVLGALSQQSAAAKLDEIGETELALKVKEAPTEADFRHGGWRWPFRTKAWQHTAHAFGYISPTRASVKGLREIVDVANIDADLSLKRTRLRVTLDALRIEEYPGSGTHHVLLDFYAQHQIRPAPEHLHFNATYRVRAGERAAIRGYPIFLGLAAGDDGVSFRCYTVNVKSEDDQNLLSFLESDTLKAGLKLAPIAQPAIGALTELARNITRGMAERRRNVPVQDIHRGLDFGDSPTGARLRLGSYIAMQVPDNEATFSWDQWMFDTSKQAIVKKDRPSETVPYNYFIFAVAKYEGP